MKEVTEEFVEKWADRFDGFIYANPGLIIDLDLLKQMLKEAGVEVVETASNARDAYGGYREDE